MDDFDLEGAIHFAESYAGIVNFNIVDLYVPEKAPVFPASWCSPDILALSELELVNLASSLYSSSFTIPDLPEDLRTFIRSCQTYSLHNHLRYQAKADHSPAGRKKNERKSVKKQHEIELLGNLIESTVSSDTDSKTAIDFGAGQGYLSQLLANKGWDVVALERDDGQCHGSITRQEESDSQRPYRVEQLNISRMTTKEQLRCFFNQTDFTCYCSLHACGSLSIDQARLFLEDDQVDLLANVGCCYNLMREDDCPPLSQHLQRWKERLQFIRDRRARMLACQAPWRWSSKAVQSIQSFRSNHFRALLQAYVLPLLEPGQETEIGHLPNSAFVTFEGYVRAACGKLNCPVPGGIVFEAIEALHDQKRLAVIWTLRALLGPVIESIILMDRYHYVREGMRTSSGAGGGSTELVPLFDPVQSPRSFVLLSRRH